jgi:hypothetical protein
MTNDERLIEAEKEFAKALDGGDVEQIIYSLGHLHGVKWAIEKERLTNMTHSSGGNERMII